jgi:hypothetical protein
MVRNGSQGSHLADYLRADERRLNGVNAPFQTPPSNREVGWQADIADVLLDDAFAPKNEPARAGGERSP